MCICAEPSGNNAGDHNLDLSLGNPNQKKKNQAFGTAQNHAHQNAAMEPQQQQSASMQFEADWRSNQGFRPKVYNKCDFNFFLICMIPLIKNLVH